MAGVYYRFAASLGLMIVLCAAGPLEQQLPDVHLVNQRGEPVMFYTDLVKGKVVIVNTFFTTCTTICPRMGSSFSRLEQRLEQSDRPDIFLISISVDPLNDTPGRLKEFAERFRAGSRWTLLTGSKADVDRVLTSLNFSVGDKLSHTSLLKALDDQTSRQTWIGGADWYTRLPEELVNMICSFAPREGRPRVHP